MEEKNYSYTNWYHIYRALKWLGINRLAKWVYDNQIFYKYKGKDIA